MVSKKYVWAALACSALMTACGGGGGSTDGGTVPASTSTISGVAASGAAMAGAGITLKDVNGVTRSATVAANGKYSVDVEGLTAPFLIKATLGDKSNYSIALPADINGRINITPLTSLIAGNALGVSPDSVFATYGNTEATAITNNSAAATSAVQLLAAALGVDVDPLRANFAADHSGLDAVLDVITVTFNGGSATISDALGNTIFTDDFTDATDIDADAIQSQQVTLDNLKDSVSEFPSVSQGIQTLLSSLTNQCGNISNYKKASCSSLYSSDLLWSGETTAPDFFDDNDDGQPDSPDIAVTFTNLVILERISSTEYRIQFKITGGWGDSSEDAFITEGLAKKNSETGLWQFAGDQQYIWLDSDYTVYPAPYGESLTGGILQLEAKLKSSNVPTGFDHLIITGPGLPDAGTTLTTSNFTTRGSNKVAALCVHESDPNLAYCPNSNNGAVTSGFSLADATTPVAFNSPNLYRITLYKADNSVISKERYWVNVFSD